MFDDLIKLAGLYRKTSQKGETYLQGTMNGKKYLIFTNNNKQAETHPDFELFVKDESIANSQFLGKEGS